MMDPSASVVLVVGGVDTHQDLHMAAAVTADGEVLGTKAFSTTRAGYRAMLGWLRSHGEVVRVGVEATGSYGAGITRHLALSGIPVLEVTGPDPSVRRTYGKDDSVDAICAARAALSGQRVSVAKDRSGALEALRALRTTRKDGGPITAGHPAATAQHRGRLSGGDPRSRTAHDPYATRPHLCRLAAGHDCLSRSGGGHQDRSQIPGPAHPRPE